MKQNGSTLILLSITLIGYIIGIIILSVNKMVSGIVLIITTLIGITAGIIFLYELRKDRKVKQNEISQ